MLRASLGIEATQHESPRKCAGPALSTGFSRLVDGCVDHLIRCCQALDNSFSLEFRSCFLYLHVNVCFCKYLHVCAGGGCFEKVMSTR